jgi:UDP-N-acetylmuramyl pentapeptide phosphotransferase/UDP-N-acetylglucosamine-1-phosphate transferase
MVNAYPIFETLFSIWRRKIHQNKNPGLPDAIHFHSLIYRRVILWKKENALNDSLIYYKNAKTSKYLWLISGIPAITAIIWCQNTLALQLFSLLYLTAYIWMYKKIIQFKTPRFLKK